MVFVLRAMCLCMMPFNFLIPWIVPYKHLIGYRANIQVGWKLWGLIHNGLYSVYIDAW